MIKLAVPAVSFASVCLRQVHCAGVAELIIKLQQRGTAVFLVSGGFRAIIHPIAKTLDIPLDHVYANTILFKVRPNLASLLLSQPAALGGPFGHHPLGCCQLQEDGSYAGFDHTELTSRSGGKYAAAVAIKVSSGVVPCLRLQHEPQLYFHVWGPAAGLPDCTYLGGL